MDRASLHLQRYNLLLWSYLISPVVFQQFNGDGFASNLKYFILQLISSILFALLINSFVKRPFRLHLWMFPFYLTVTT
ncbi:MAG: hypothetical protein Q8J65_03445, partial [Nitrosomonadales bacterium]|nr:hypothetical protein [Nitrosomonadales bacterium]